MKKIISILLSFLLFSSLCFIPVDAENYKSDYTEISVNQKYQKFLTKGETQRYCFTATESQYYSFYFGNQSLEVRSGIGFVDGFLNLFVGKLSVTIYDQYDLKLTSFEVRCGYELNSTLKLSKDQKYYFHVSSSVEGNYIMKVSMLADIGGDSWDHATEVLPTHQIISAIDASGDQDWFVFTTDSDLSFYNFSLENIQGDSSLYFYLYEFIPGAGATPLRDVTNFQVYSNSSNSKNLKLKQDHTYYFCIYMPNGTKGGYVLDSTQRIDSCGDVKEEAFSLDLEKTYITSFDGTSDTDYYRFTTENFDAYYNFVFHPLTTLNAYISMNLYDQNGSEIFNKRVYSDSFSQSVKLNKNAVYYLYLYCEKPGNYDFAIDVKKDNEGNTKEEAYEVPLNFKYTTSFDGTSDTDYYRFTTENFDAYYNFVFHPLTTLNAYISMNLYDQNGSEIFNKRVYSDSFSQSVKLNKNAVYYLYLYCEKPGNYDFAIDVKKDNEGNTKEEALSIKINQVTECGFEASDDVDWFTAKVTTAGNYRLVMINESCGNPPYIYLYNSREKQLAYTTSSTTVWLDAGVYYLKATPRYSSAGYYSVVLADCGNGHKEGNKYRPAGYKTQGTKIVYCKCCGQEIRKESVEGIASVSLATSTLVYSGKNLRPTVVAKNTGGKTIKSYDLTYSASNSIKAGTYKVTVTFNGAYQYQKTLTYKIAPKLSISSKTMYVGETYTLKASGGSKYTYKSGKTSVASINSKGVITAKKAGTATITVTANGVSKTCKITVKTPTVKLNKSSITVQKKKMITLKATTKPGGKVKWKSSNKKVATVSSKGVVKGMKKGSATITCTYTYKGKTYKKTCKIKVR